MKKFLLVTALSLSFVCMGGIAEAGKDPATMAETAESDKPSDISQQAKAEYKALIDYFETHSQMWKVAKGKGVKKYTVVKESIKKGHSQLQIEFPDGLGQTALVTLSKDKNHSIQMNEKCKGV